MCPPNTYSSDGFVSSTCHNCSDGQYQLMYGVTIAQLTIKMTFHLKNAWDSHFN